MKGMRNIAPFGLRMPDELREAVAQRAKANGRSMNSEIIHILEETVKSETIAWSESLSPKANVENFYLSNEQLSKMLRIAAEETFKEYLKINKKPSE